VLRIKIYYWKTRPNFGDSLTPLLLKKFSRLESEWAEPEDAELVAVGSVIDKLPEDWSGIIAGSGKLHEKTKVNFPNARILGLRGPLTAKGVKGNFALGDPALLCDELIGNQDKEYDLGIVLHWTDKTLEQNPIFKKYNPLIIRVSDDPLEVIRQIGLCKKIVSSSLHVIIVADAFGIPRRIEIPPRALSHPHQEGGLFKWHDYSASIDMKLEIGVTQEPDKHKVNDRQDEIYDVFKEIKAIFSSNISG